MYIASQTRRGLNNNKKRAILEIMFVLKFPKCFTRHVRTKKKQNENLLDLCSPAFLENLLLCFKNVLSTYTSMKIRISITPIL